MPDTPQIPLIFIPPRYQTDDFVSNDTPSGVLSFVPFFEPWFRLVTGESLNRLVVTINELILRLNLQRTQRLITAAGDVTVELGEYQILMDKAVPAVTNIRLPSVTEWVNGGYDFAGMVIKDLGYTASSFPLTILPDGSDTIDGLAQWQIAGDGASVALYALEDKTGWYVA